MHTVKPRNPYACSPLLKKGGAHRSSRSGLRQNARQAMLAEHHHWLEVMGNTFEILLLFGRQIHGYFFIGQG